MNKTEHSFFADIREGKGSCSEYMPDIPKTAPRDTVLISTFFVSSAELIVAVPSSIMPMRWSVFLGEHISSPAEYFRRQQELSFIYTEILCAFASLNMTVFFNTGYLSKIFTADILRQDCLK